MKKLRQNIVNIYGKKGETWLLNLPTLIHDLSTHWQLSQVMPVANMTFNYVATAVTKTQQFVVIKISYDEKNIAAEYEALKYFDGKGAIQVIDYHKIHHALLLQQAIPGTTLKYFYPEQIDYVMNCYVDTMQKLHYQKPLYHYHFKHIDDWLQAINEFNLNQMYSSDLTKKALYLKNELLKTMRSEIILHGDLHHDNILKNNDEWLTIDPKGIVGETEFEIAAFDFMNINEFANQSDVGNILINRINLLAQKANLDTERIKAWVFVRLILMAAWLVEDNDDPRLALKLAETLKEKVTL